MANGDLDGDIYFAMFDPNILKYVTKDNIKEASSSKSVKS